MEEAREGDQCCSVLRDDEDGGKDEERRECSPLLS